MKSFIGLTKRNMLVYLRDRATVFFSLLSPLIILFLYIMFLKQNYVDSVNSIIVSAGLSDFITNKQVDGFVNSWLISGLLASSCITVPLSSLTLIVTDKEKQRDYDLLASPVKKWKIGLSYLVASFLNTLIITGIILTIGIIIITSSGLKMEFIDIIKSYLVVIIGSLSGSAFMYMIVSLFKKSSTVGAFTGIVCAASGFLIGAYMPISMFADWLQVLANTIPGSHIAGLFRNILMGNALSDMNSLIQSTEFINSMNEAFSLELNFFGSMIKENTMWIYSICSLVVMVVVDVIVFIKASKRK